MDSPSETRAAPAITAEAAAVADSVDVAPEALHSPSTAPPRLAIEALVERWQSLSLRAATTLRQPEAGQLVAAVSKLDGELQTLLASDEEGSILHLMHSAGLNVQRYSVMHALLVTVVCELSARNLPECDDAQRTSLRHAALTMNIGMTRLQDELALQDGTVSEAQREEIQNHACRSKELLAEMGVEDAVWLEAVEHHHDAPPGPLSSHGVAIRLARLIQRADVFSARMSPRKMRPALSATVAAKGAYFDENEQPDEAGSLIIKALGIYPPGSYVQLASGELAVVLRRGPAPNRPHVACMADSHGSPYVQPIVRASNTKATMVVKGVPPKDIRVRVPVERLLKLARSTED
jgi:hypothetical protein